MDRVAEWSVGSARREILDHVIVLDDRHLGRIVGEYKGYFNEARRESANRSPGSRRELPMSQSRSW